MLQTTNSGLLRQKAGGESRSGKKIPRLETVVPVRFRPRAPLHIFVGRKHEEKAFLTFQSESACWLYRASLTTLPSLLSYHFHVGVFYYHFMYVLAMCRSLAVGCGHRHVRQQAGAGVALGDRLRRQRRGGDAVFTGPAGVLLAHMDQYTDLGQNDVELFGRRLTDDHAFADLSARAP